MRNKKVKHEKHTLVHLCGILNVTMGFVKTSPENKKILGTFKYLHWLFPMLCLDREGYNLGVISLVLLIQTL